MVISVELEKEDLEYIETCSRRAGMAVSDFIKMAALEWIEDEYDRKVYEKAMEEYRKNPVTCTHEEVCRMLELEE